jgi:ribosomal protein S18 acetylase RimI-like enzyme
VILRDLGEEELPSAARVLADGMRDNPLHIRVFGEDADRREEALARLFAAAIARVGSRGIVEGAFDGTTLVGVCGRVPPGKCRFSLAEKMKVLPAMLAGNSVTVVSRIYSWVGAWTALDPDAPHWHLGPVAVRRAHQGKGVGSTLLRAFCARMDQERAEAYLETDKESNVRFYERAGFTVGQRKDVVGVPCWFMSRPGPGAPNS